MKSSDESLDSLLKDLVEIIDDSSPSVCTTSCPTPPKLYLDWPTGNETLVPACADWSAARQQTEPEIATWGAGATGSDVTATWEAVFESAPLKSLCSLPPERFDVSRLISVPSLVATPPPGHQDDDVVMTTLRVPHTSHHDDDVVMTTLQAPPIGHYGDDIVMTTIQATQACHLDDEVVMTTLQATQGILLHDADSCDRLENSLGDLDLDIDLGRPLDVSSRTPSSAFLTLSPSGTWLVTPSTPALPLNVSQPLRGRTSEMESSLEDVGTSGKNRLCSRCLSDSEVQLTAQDSPLFVRQGSKRQRKGTATARNPGVRGRSTSEAGPSRTTSTEEAEVDSFRLLRRREQNRRAARVCRERKRAMSTSMVKEYQDLLSSNTTLRFEIRQLQQQEQNLQSVLENHLTTCTSLTSSPPTSSHPTLTLAQAADDPMTLNLQ